MEKQLSYTQGHSYLVKHWESSVINKLTILQVTQTAYKIKWENGNERWILHHDMEQDYRLVEDLGNEEAESLKNLIYNAI